MSPILKSRSCIIFGFFPGREIPGSSLDVIRGGVLTAGWVCRLEQSDWEDWGVGGRSASCQLDRIRNHLGDKSLGMVGLTGVRRSCLLCRALFPGWFPGRAKWEKAAEHGITLFWLQMQCGQLPLAPATTIPLPWWTVSVNREPM